MSRPSYRGSRHSVSPSWGWGWLLWGWRWLLSVTIAMFCVMAFLALLTPTSIGQRVSNTLRFLFGWHYITQHQRQLPQAVDSVLQKTGLARTVYRLEDLRPQRRGQEHWQRQRHVISVPPDVSLNTFEALFQAALSRSPFTVLARDIQQTPQHIAIKLTCGIAGVPTDIFVFTQVHTAARAAYQVRNTQRSLPPTPLPPLHPLPLPQIAIVIDDLGWDLEAAQILLALDVPLSFAILPHTPYTNFIAREAQRRGRDVLLHLPMEPYSYPHVNPGQPVLLSTMNSHELSAQVENALDTLPAAIGVNNHMGSRLTEDRTAMRVVMQLMKHHNLFFLDSRTSHKSLAFQVARELGVRTAQRHVFLDNETEPGKLSEQLYRLATLAREHGSAIGIGHPYPETIQSLQYILPGILHSGVEMVPVSRLVQ